MKSTDINEANGWKFLDKFELRISDVNYNGPNYIEVEDFVNFSTDQCIRIDRKGDKYRIATAPNLLFSNWQSFV